MAPERMAQAGLLQSNGGRMIELDPDAFSDGQIRSKMWLCEEVERFTNLNETLGGPAKISVYAGWYGMLSFILLTRKRYPFRIDHIRSYDIDPKCEGVANLLLNRWEMEEWKFHAETCDVNSIVDFDDMNFVINTSTEHMSMEWFNNLPRGMFVCLQGTDQVEPDHVNTCSTLDEFEHRYVLSTTFFRGILNIDYPNRSIQRFMSIGIK